MALNFVGFLGFGGNKRHIIAQNICLNDHNADVSRVNILIARKYLGQTQNFII